MRENFDSPETPRSGTTVMTKTQAEAIRWTIQRVRDEMRMDWGMASVHDWTWHPMHPTDVEECAAQTDEMLPKQHHGMRGA